MKITLGASAAVVAALSVSGAQATAPPAGELIGGGIYSLYVPQASAGVFFAQPPNATHVAALCAGFESVWGAGSPRGVSEGQYHPALAEFADDYIEEAGSVIAPLVNACGAAYDNTAVSFAECAVAAPFVLQSSLPPGLPEPDVAFGTVAAGINTGDLTSIIGYVTPWLTEPGSTAISTLLGLIFGEGKTFATAAVELLYCRGAFDWDDVMGNITPDAWTGITTLGTGLPTAFPWATAPDCAAVQSESPAAPSEVTFQPLLDMLDTPPPALPPPFQNMGDVWFYSCGKTSPPVTSSPTDMPTTSAPTTTTSAPTDMPSTSAPTDMPSTSAPTSAPTAAPTRPPTEPYLGPYYPQDLLLLAFVGQHAAEIQDILAAIVDPDLALHEILAGILFPYQAPTCGYVAAAKGLKANPFGAACLGIAPTGVSGVLSLVMDILYGATGLDAACSPLGSFLGENIMNMHQLRALADFNYVSHAAVTPEAAALVAGAVDAGIAVIENYDITPVLTMVDSLIAAADVTCATEITPEPTAAPVTAAPTSASNMATVSVAAAIAAIALM